LRQTPLHDLHVAHGARMVGFAGYDMPVQYPTGIITEHLHTRARAGLFDVSHMGQVRLHGAAAIAALEKLIPGDIEGLAPGRMRYSLLLNEAGGIIDDLMITRLDAGLMLVVNAACKETDIAHLKDRLEPIITVEPLPDRALLALQGPEAAVVLARFAPGIERMPFMSAGECSIAGATCGITRSGYTGEDGFEISVANAQTVVVAETLLAEVEVAPIGLGARDSLRLEAGLCLYGHDIDATTSPIEAGLAWTISKRRRAEGGFPAADRILRELAEGPNRRRVGIRPDGRAPAREGTLITDAAGTTVGIVTSGGFGPSVDADGKGAPIAMGYVDPVHSAEGTALSLVVRGTPRPARIVKLPFVPTRYYRG
jgi:aminomethyltransferase